MLEVPTDFSSPQLDRIKSEIISILQGPLGSLSLTEEGALRKIRQAHSSEWGYSDELAKSLPEWKARFPEGETAPLPQVVQPQEPERTEAPADSGKNAKEVVPEPASTPDLKPEELEKPQTAPEEKKAPQENPYKKQA